MENNKKKKVVRGGDKIPAPPVIVSASELTQGDPRIQNALEKCGLEFILNKLWGFDDKQHYQSTGTFYEVQKLKHRNRKGVIVECERYSGVERLDDEWITEGIPSNEALIAARQDLSYVKEISKMSRQIKSS